MIIDHECSIVVSFKVGSFKSPHFVGLDVAVYIVVANRYKNKEEEKSMD